MADGKVTITKETTTTRKEKKRPPRLTVNKDLKLPRSTAGVRPKKENTAPAQTEKQNQPVEIPTGNIGRMLALQAKKQDIQNNNNAAVNDYEGALGNNQKAIQHAVDRADTITELGESVKSIAKNFKSPKRAAEAIAAELNQQVLDGHKGVVYVLIICMALIKDGVDVLSAETLSLFDWPVDLMFGLILRGFFWGKGTWKVKVVILAASALEMIPGSGALPTWTIAALYAYRVDTKRVQKLKAQAEKYSELSKKQPTDQEVINKRLKKWKQAS